MGIRQGVFMSCIARLVLPFVIACLAFPAMAEKRVALVIGNAAYKHAPALANPKNDAEGMAAALKRLKFDVLAGTDLDKPAMERLLQAFSLKLETADVALIFYAGHGLQVHGRNYLVPVDGKLDREADLVFQAVPLDVIQGLMEQSQRTNIMILDACRDNPLARNLARTMGTRSASIGRGLGEAKAGIGTLIVYATQPGNVALDGDTKNSPFTAALLKHIEAPGLEIRQVLTRVRNDVITTTREKQVPWDSSSLRGDFFFAAAAGAPETKAPAETKPGETKPPAATDPPPRGADGEIVFWQSIKDSKNAADFKDYLARWPSGTFADLAKRRIAELEKAAVVTPPVPEKPEKTEPAKPPLVRRTSTLIANSAFDLGARAFGGGRGVATPQRCSAMCVADTRCAAWTHHPVDYGADTVNPTIREMKQQLQGLCRLFAAPPKSEYADKVFSGVIRTIPAAAPAQPAAPKPSAAPKAQPAAPAQPARPRALTPSRTNTFEVGTTQWGGTALENKTGVPSAQACQALCIGHPQCVAWIWVQPNAGAPTAFFCALKSTLGQRNRSEFNTSGEVPRAQAR